jgi:uncharacterized membrane protein SpoIIM required for sporulation
VHILGRLESRVRAAQGTATITRVQDLVEVGARWEELERLLSRIEKKGERSLSFDEIERMGALYRQAAAQLADARERKHDVQRMRYLDALIRRAHFVIYAPPKRGLIPLLRLAAGGFARAYRETLGFQLIALALFFGGAIIGYVATMNHVEVAYPILKIMFPPDLVQELVESPEKRAAYITSGRAFGTGMRSAFTAMLAANNARVGLVAFAVGIAAGVPTAILVVFNGAVLGSFAALFDRPAGLNLNFWAWVLPHGIPEALALTICGAAGILVGSAFIDPKGRPRRESLVDAGRSAALLIGMALFLFVYAASIEGYFRQETLGIVPRFILAAFNLVVLVLYLARAGTALEDEPRRR